MIDVWAAKYAKQILNKKASVYTKPSRLSVSAGSLSSILEVFEAQQM